MPVRPIFDVAFRALGLAGGFLFDPGIFSNTAVFVAHNGRHGGIGVVEQFATEFYFFVLQLAVRAEKLHNCSCWFGVRFCVAARANGNHFAGGVYGLRLAGVPAVLLHAFGA